MRLVPRPQPDRLRALHGQRLLSQEFALLGRAPFYFIAALFMHVLWKHADMTNKRDTGIGNCSNLLVTGLTPFQLHRI